MTENEILDALGRGEDQDREFKLGRGGVPRSLWETYSAMANTDGGVIVLGIRQTKDGCVPVGLQDVGASRKQFWDTINNRSKVNTNILVDSCVQTARVAGVDLLTIEVPRATRTQRPVYVGLDPMNGTYRRNYEGDYKCSPDEVSRMLADGLGESADSRILETFTLDDLDDPTIKQYRQVFSSLRPDHVWGTLDTTQFLEKLGAWRTDRSTHAQGPTVAGMLMFGKHDAIIEPGSVPFYGVDYRAHFSEKEEVRWTDRVTADGTWCANLFQFYLKVIQKLTANLAVPFQLDADLTRRDDTPVHEAIREALVNALIHADYKGRGGVVIEHRRDKIEVSNPGSLLISREQLRRGGVSECRNMALQKAFQMIGRGERAGSGYDKILRGWASQQWRSPSIQESVEPDRVRLFLPMISLIPPDSAERLRMAVGAKWGRLTPEEVQALVTADVEGQVSNARLQEISEKHPADLTAVLRRLVTDGLLKQHGATRGTYYVLGPKAVVRAPLVVTPEYGAGTTVSASSFSSVTSLQEASPGQRVVQLARAEGFVTNEKVRTLLDVGPGRANWLLRKLTKTGELKKTGRNKGTKYLPRPEAG